MQHVTVKGWKDFSNIFSDGSNKTSLPGDGSPGEDSSLLGGGGTGKKQVTTSSSFFGYFYRVQTKLHGGKVSRNFGPSIQV